MNCLTWLCPPAVRIVESEANVGVQRRPSEKGLAVQSHLSCTRFALRCEQLRSQNPAALDQNPALCMCFRMIWAANSSQFFALDEAKTWRGISLHCNTLQSVKRPKQTHMTMAAWSFLIFLHYSSSSLLVYSWNSPIITRAASGGQQIRTARICGLQHHLWNPPKPSCNFGKTIRFLNLSSQTNKPC